MHPRWEELRHAPPPPQGGFLMDAALRPNRSLSRRGFAWLLAVFGVVNLVMAAVFLAHGVYPVAGFLGLDVIAFALAFLVSYRSGRRMERVQVAADRIYVARLPPKGQATHYAVHPSWARVSAEPHAVRISAGGRFLDVGAFLSPNEREEFAVALAAAVRRARVVRP